MSMYMKIASLNSLYICIFACVGSVKRKGAKFSATLNAIDSARASKEEHIVDKQPLVLVANEEFEKEIGGYQSEPESDEDEEQPDALHVASTPKTNTISKKRKASKKLLSSMYAFTVLACLNGQLLSVCECLYRWVGWKGC
ncbi:hypothetical protein Ancab_022136 [Ancistrocladus abbreviatus]